MSKKAISKMLAIVAIIIVAVAAIGGGLAYYYLTRPVAPEAEVTLRAFMLMPADTPGSVVLQGYMDKFENETGINVESTYVAYEEWKRAWSAMIAAGTPPDIQLLAGPTEFLPECAIGAVAYMNDLKMPDGSAVYDGQQIFGSSARLAAIPQGLIESSTFSVNGKLVGVPLDVGTSMLVWNKQAFIDAGLDPNNGPDTWEEVLADALTIKANAPAYYPFGLPMAREWNLARYFEILYYSKTGQPIIDENGKVLVNTTDVADAVQWFFDLHNVHDLTNPDPIDVNQYDNRALFRDGKIAMMIESPHFLKAVMESAGKGNFSTAETSPFGFSLVPAWEIGGRRISWTLADIMYVTAYSKHKVEAAQLVEYLTRSKNLYDFNSGWGTLYPTTEMADKPYYANNKWFWDKIKEQVTGGNAMGTDAGLIEAGFADDLLMTNLQKAFMGQITVKEALDDYAQKVTVKEATAREFL